MPAASGIDTEGDNQWDAAARAQPDVREHLRAAAAARAVRAARRAADLRDHLSGRERPAVRATCCAAAGGRRLRDRRAPSRLGDAAVHGRGRHAGIRTRRTCRCAQFEAQLASLTDAIAARRRRAAGLVPVGPLRVLGGARRRRSSGWAISSNRASRRCSTRRTRAARTSSRRRSRRTSSPYDSATRPGTSGVLEVPVSAALNRRLPRRLQYLLRARAAAVHDEARPAEARRRARALAAAVVLVARGHDRARARSRRATGEPVLNLLFHSSEAIVGGSPYNRTRGRARRVLRSARAVLRVRAAGARRGAGDVRRIQARVHRRRSPLTRCMRIVHVTPHLPPDQAANALLPFQLGQLGARARRRGRVHRASAARRAGRTRSPVRSPGFPREQRRTLQRCAATGLDCRRAGASGGAPRRVIATRRSRPRPQQRAAGGSRVRGWRAAPGKPVVLTLYGTEIWHYRPKRLGPISSRARIDAASVVTFYSDRLLRARVSSAWAPGLPGHLPAGRATRSRVTTRTRSSTMRRALGHDAVVTCCSTSSACTRSPASASCSKR